MKAKLFIIIGLLCHLMAFGVVKHTVQVVVTDTVRGRVDTLWITGDVIMINDTTIIDLIEEHASGGAIGGTATLNRLAVGSGTNTLQGEDSLLWQNGGLEITGNLTVDSSSYLNGIYFTGSTKTAGAFYTGTSNPTNTNRLNFDGYLYASRLYAPYIEIQATTTTGLSSTVSSGTGIYGYATSGIGAYTRTGTGQALYVERTGNNNSSDTLLLIKDLTGGSANTTYPYIAINANPTTSGTISNKLLVFKIAGIDRTIINPYINSSTAYIFDTHNPLVGEKHSVWMNQGDTIIDIDSIQLQVHNNLTVDGDSAIFAGYIRCDSIYTLKAAVWADYIWLHSYKTPSLYNEIQYAKKHNTLEPLKEHSQNLGKRQERIIESLERLYIQVFRNFKLVYLLVLGLVIWNIILTFRKR